VSGGEPTPSQADRQIPSIAKTLRFKKVWAASGEHGLFKCPGGSTDAIRRATALSFDEHAAEQGFPSSLFDHVITP
jgi:hypothetical protein